ncbi:hypothetical protein [Breznakiella homolactica]|uniref:Uncharacterized protein n=1 Tax=Breznakiella homolactica TaxID=2798577 RepID=A0A7T8BA66_9SPIR|nr:hypothetical protein [Breznakiella homolactica]QQO08675.1 hypothetical protein JFL75_17360 [Breznakiella homolactica]
MGIFKDIKKAYSEGYQSASGTEKIISAEQLEATTIDEQFQTGAAAENQYRDQAADAQSEKENEISNSIRSIFFSLLGTFIFLLAGIFVFSLFSEKGNTGLMLLGIPIAIFPIIVEYFRSGSISAILTDSLHEKPEEYRDSQGRTVKRTSGTGFAGLLISVLVLLFGGIFLTIIKVIILLFRWIILAIQSKGRAFISPYNIPLLCIVALAGLLLVLNLTNPGMVSFEF